MNLSPQDGPMILDRVRSVVAPRSGDDYELFNLSAGFLALVLGTYLLGSPSPATSSALAWLLAQTSLPLWTVVLNACAVTALACSYVRPALPAGRGVLLAAAGVWSAVLFLGWLTSINLNAGLDLKVVVSAAALGTYAALVLVVLACAPFPRSEGGRSTLVSWPLRRTLLRAAGLGAVVFLIVMVWGALGDPRQLTSATIYGMFARSAAHQSKVAASRRARVAAMTKRRAPHRDDPKNLPHHNGDGAGW